MKRMVFVISILLSLAAIQSQVRGQTPVAMTLDGPLAVTPGQVATYFVNISGGPAEVNGTFTVRYWVEGPDTTGASPLQGGPGDQSSQNNTFKINITAISHEGTMDIVVEGTSKNNSVNTTVRKTLTAQVLTPLVLAANFANDGGAAAVNVTVRFYVDDTYAGMKIISRINPGDRGTATLSWLPVGLSHGQHSVMIEADLDGNGVIDPTKGETFSYDIFYKTGGEIATGYLVLLGIAICVVGILGFLAYRRRLKTR